MNEPYTFQMQNYTDFFNLQPSQVKGRANTAVEYHKRYLYNKIYSLFDFTIPKEWDLNWFRFWLFRYGSIAVLYTKEFGWVAQPYGVTELNVYYNPKKILVNNQFISNKTGIVDVNCGIVHLFDDFFGIDDLVTKYAEMLAQIDKDININLMNANVSLVYEAESKKEADAIKEAYGTATTGMPLVTINRDLMNSKKLTSLIDVGANYIVDKLLNARRTIINAFLTEVGINNANAEKKERLITSEVNANNDETESIVSVMYGNIKASMERINTISDLKLDVAFHFNYNVDTEREEKENA